MKRFLILMILVCLPATAIAGEIPSVPGPPPPPDELTATATGSTSALSDVTSGGFTQEVTETALTLIQLAISGVL